MNARRIRIASVIGLLLAITVAGSAWGVDKSTGATKESVTGTLRVYYDIRNCSGGGREMRINRVTTKFSRVNGAHREISAVHLDAWEGVRNCANNGVDESRGVTQDPEFGCGGRCGQNQTEELGMTVNWPYVFVPDAPDCLICEGGAAAHVHISNLVGDPVTTMCLRLPIPNNNMGAPQCR